MLLWNWLTLYNEHLRIMNASNFHAHIEYLLGSCWILSIMGLIGDGSHFHKSQISKYTILEIMYIGIWMQLEYFFVFPHRCTERVKVFLKYKEIDDYQCHKQRKEAIQAHWVHLETACSRIVFRNETSAFSLKMRSARNLMFVDHLTVSQPSWNPQKYTTV